MLELITVVIGFSPDCVLLVCEFVRIKPLVKGECFLKVCHSNYSKVRYFSAELGKIYRSSRFHDRGDQTRTAPIHLGLNRSAD